MSYYDNKIEEIIEEAVKKCEKICEKCGSNNDVQLTDTPWIHNYCKECRGNSNAKVIDKKNNNRFISINIKVPKT
jgi:hypothetical protein